MGGRVLEESETALNSGVATVGDVGKNDSESGSCVGGTDTKDPKSEPAELGVTRLCCLECPRFV